MFGLYRKMTDLHTRWLRSMSIKQIIIYTILFILSLAFLLPWISDLSYQLIGVRESIDASFFTEVKDLYLLRDEYGSEGRHYYIVLRVTFDLVWPIIYYLFLASITAYLSKHVNTKSNFRYINYLPIIAVLLDFLENILAIFFMAMYPYQVDFIAFLIIVVSINKWVWIAFSFIQIFYLLMKRGVTYVRK